MFGRETRMLLRHCLEQGTSKSALAPSWASIATRSAGGLATAISIVISTACPFGMGRGHRWRRSRREDSDGYRAAQMSFSRRDNLILLDKPAGGRKHAASDVLEDR